MTGRTLKIFVFILLAMSGRAVGQNLPVGSSAGESEEDRLAREVEDPTAILMQLQLQDLYTPRNFQTCAWSKLRPRDGDSASVILQRAMLALLTKILLALRSLLEVPASREAEILVLRQQLLVLSRKSPRHARLRNIDLLW